MSQGTILILGGGGKTGARVNAQLRARGIATRPVSRSTETPFENAGTSGTFSAEYCWNGGDDETRTRDLCRDRAAF
jgi:hypothetical protein